MYCFCYVAEGTKLIEFVSSKNHLSCNICELPLNAFQLIEAEKCFIGLCSGCTATFTINRHLACL